MGSAKLFDLIVRNGTVVDGLGNPRQSADVGIIDGRIAAIGVIDGEARQEIDADGLIVAPGFVDPHTHFDAQICWDNLLTPSCWHGVTSVVMGNCGVGIAPVRNDPQSREIATRDLVLVEDIAYEVLSQGIDWQWSSFAEYMSAAERRPCALNTAFIAPLTPFRHWVMGADSLDRPANADEREAIKAMVQDAVKAGAVGFSTTILPNHNGYLGKPLAARQADEEELTAYCRGLREIDAGVVQLGLTNIGIMGDREIKLLDLLTRESGRPVTWLALLDRENKPDMCQETLRATEAYRARGAVGQVSCRPLTLNIDMWAPTLLAADMPSMKQVAGKSRDELRSLYADPGFRAAFRADMDGGPFMFAGRWDLMMVHEAETDAVKALLGRTLSDIAAERGADAIDTFFDLAVEDGVGISYNYEAFNINEERVAQLITDPRTMIGISDAGAHVDMLCDASYTTYLLGHWVREKGVMTLEQAVKRITSEPADFFGLADRGRLQEGMAADIVIFDAEKIGSQRRPTELVADLPGGGKRLITRAEGVVHLIVNGTPVFQDGEPLGPLPGTVLRPKVKAAA